MKTYTHFLISFVCWVLEDEPLADNMTDEADTETIDEADPEFAMVSVAMNRMV